MWGVCLAGAMTAWSAMAQGPAQPAVRISADLSTSTGAYRPVYAWFGYDEANYTTMAHGRQLLRELHDLSPVPVQIRAHHLLTSGDGTAELKFSSTNVYHEDASGRPVYDFTLLDGIFDAYRDAGVRPMVELGFMPKDLAATLPGRDTYQVHYPQSTVSGASNNPPKDYAKWQELVRVVTHHLVERYGRETVRQWYFEVWNEPDIDYWHATPQEYWKLYDYAVAGVRAALPEAKVGGPASTSPSGQRANAFLRGFLDHVKSDKSMATGGKIPLDFISFHAKGQPKIVDGHVTMGIAHELADADSGFAVVASYAEFKRLPIILSEADPEGCAACSSRVNPANNYRNGTLYPAYTAAAYKALLELGDRHGVDLISMLSWSFEFEGKDYFEGFRSLASNGIDKPVLNLFRMLGMMGGERVATTSTAGVPLDTLVHQGVRSAADVDALATYGDRRAAVLVWNYHDSAEPAAPSEVHLQLRGLPTGVRRVLVQQYRIDETHSNAYTLWKQMGGPQQPSPQQPSPQQLDALHAAQGLQLLQAPEWAEVANGAVVLTTSMPRQSVSLFAVSW
ncbi:MAG: beta-xylosidase [Acidobacteriota bacterium]|nr:beta-xylosidase [Acidobacteriota bacterium]